MNIETLNKQFQRIGARAIVNTQKANTRTRFTQRENRDLLIDIRTDAEGEYVSLDVGPDVELVVPDIQPDIRHLLLIARHRSTAIRKEKFVCGFDERHWFVSAIPDTRGVSNVRTALEALKPAGVVRQQERKRVRTRDSLKRKTAAWIRQGEWFFIPVEHMVPKDWLILHKEPLRRGLGKPHLCEYIYRTGGEKVYLSEHYHKPLKENEYRLFLKRSPRARKWPWKVHRQDPGVYAKGWVRHPDHKTIALSTWHQVLMNRENEAPSMRHVAFID